MVVAFVRLQASLTYAAMPKAGRIYALLLPSAVGNEWAELDVLPSPLGGFGVFPRGDGLSWIKNPVLLPYFGVETVVKSTVGFNALLSVLKGAFQNVTIEELQARIGERRTYVQDGLFVIPQSPASREKQPLPVETSLLQIGAAGGHAHYLLADEVRTVLHLVGERAHLFNLLCAHEKHEHTDRHFATHVASVQRMEVEAETSQASPHHVIINAHPAFGMPESITGMVNEPSVGQKPVLKMIQAHARFLEDDDLLMKQHMLTQPVGAEAAWRKHVMRPIGADLEKSAAAGDESWRYSERMTLYQTTRDSYSSEHELTVDYGKKYARSYFSGSHRPTVRPLYTIAPEAIEASAPATWPNLPGWFNPKQQPKWRPAFEVLPPRRGCGDREGIRVLPDDPEVVAACKAALEVSRGNELSHAEEIPSDTRLVERMRRVLQRRVT